MSYSFHFFCEKKHFFFCKKKHVEGLLFCSSDVSLQSNGYPSLPSLRQLTPPPRQLSPFLCKQRLPRGGTPNPSSTSNTCTASTSAHHQTGEGGQAPPVPPPGCVAQPVQHRLVLPLPRRLAAALLPPGDGGQGVASAGRTPPPWGGGEGVQPATHGGRQAMPGGWRCTSTTPRSASSTAAWSSTWRASRACCGSGASAELDVWEGGRSLASLLSSLGYSFACNNYRHIKGTMYSAKPYSVKEMVTLE